MKNLREKKVLTTAERNDLVVEYGPLQIATVSATEEMPKITKLTDQRGFCTSHFMVQDLFEWQFGPQIEALPEDGWLPVPPDYTMSYKTEYGVVPESHKFRLTHGEYTLTENDLPVLEDTEEMKFEGWMIDGQLVEVGHIVKGSVELVAKWSEIPPTYTVNVVDEGEGVEFVADKEVAEAGEVITITAEAQEGYEVKSITAEYEGGVVEVTAGEVPNTYTFVMPEGDVTVTGVGGAVAVEEPTDTEGGEK